MPSTHSQFQTRIHPSSFGSSWAGGVHPLSRASAPAPPALKPKPKQPLTASGFANQPSPPAQAPPAPSISRATSHSSTTTTTTDTYTTGSSEPEETIFDEDDNEAYGYYDEHEEEQAPTRRYYSEREEEQTPERRYYSEHEEEQTPERRYYDEHEEEQTPARSLDLSSLHFSASPSSSFSHLSSPSPSPYPYASPEPSPYSYASPEPSLSPSPEPEPITPPPPPPPVSSSRLRSVGGKRPSTTAMRGEGERDRDYVQQHVRGPRPSTHEYAGRSQGHAQGKQARRYASRSPPKQSHARASYRQHHFQSHRPLPQAPPPNSTHPHRTVSGPAHVEHHSDRRSHAHPPYRPQPPSQPQPQQQQQQQWEPQRPQHHPRQHPSEPQDDDIPRLRAALASLDARMSALAMERATLQSHLDTAVRRQAPIYRLPGELLSSIFTMGVLGRPVRGSSGENGDGLDMDESNTLDELADDGPEEDSLMVTVLMLVCRGWNRIALETPELWAKIVLVLPSHPTTTANAQAHSLSLSRARQRLIRSKSSPLDITVRFAENVLTQTHSQPEPQAHGPLPPSPEQLLLKAMDIVLPSLWRARCLTLLVPSKALAYRALARCSRESAPVMETLVVKVVRGMWDGGDWELSMREGGGTTGTGVAMPMFNNDTPMLRCVSFSSLNIGWDLGKRSSSTASSSMAQSLAPPSGPSPQIMQNLRHLSLSGYFNAGSPSVDSLLSVLRTCPELQTLELRNMSDVDIEGCHSPFSDNEDYFGSGSGSGSSSAYPSFASTFDGGLSGSSPGPSGRYDFLSHLPPRSVHLPRLTKLVFNNSGIVRTLLLMHQLTYPSLRSLELSFLQNITPVLDALYETSLTRLPLRVLRVESSWFDIARMGALLRRLNGLRELVFVDVEDMGVGLMKTLSSTRPWVLPNLSSLTLDSCTAFTWDALRTLVESRLPPDTTPRSMAAIPHQNQPPKYPVRRRSPLVRKKSSTGVTVKQAGTGGWSSASGFAAKMRNRAGSGSGSMGRKAGEKARPKTSSASAAAAVFASSKASTSAYPLPCTAPFAPPASAQANAGGYGMPSVPGAKRLSYVDVTRCVQISKEMVQWLRMYVDEVACDQFGQRGYGSGSGSGSGSGGRRRWGGGSSGSSSCS